MAVILAWALQALWGTNQDAGAVVPRRHPPNTVLRRIRDISVSDRVKQGSPRRGGTRSTVGRARRRPPLTLIDEIDVYERTRLEEEGITSVQALAGTTSST